MKRKVDIFYLIIRLGLCFLLVFTPRLLSAQEDNTRFIPDSIRIRPELKELLSSPLKLSPGRGLSSSVLQPTFFDSLPHFSLKKNIHLPYHTNPSPLFQGDYLFPTAHYMVVEDRQAFRVLDESMMLR